MRNQELVPVVKIGSEETYHPQYVIPCDSYVVKIDDLLTSTGLKFNKYVDLIKKKGGLRGFFNNNSESILSPIMPDKKTAGCDRTRFLSIIQATLPDLIITPDGETYHNEIRRSKHVMEKSLDCIDFLLENGVVADQLIGLVLGSNLRQIDDYISALKDRKITKYCFHAGDFHFRRNTWSKRLALDYARHIRERVQYLIIYGGGSRKFFQRYHFADAFVTQSHFVAGFKHKKICRDGQKRYDKVISWDFIMSNLFEIYHYQFHREDHMKLTDSIYPHNIVSSEILVLNKKVLTQLGGK